jgi:hypothetical protein
MFIPFALAIAFFVIGGIAGGCGSNEPTTPEWTPAGNGWEWDGYSQRWRRGAPSNPEQWIKNGSQWEYKPSW